MEIRHKLYVLLKPLENYSETVENRNEVLWQAREMSKSTKILQKSILLRSIPVSREHSRGLFIFCHFRLYMHHFEANIASGAMPV